MGARISERQLAAMTGGKLKPKRSLHPSEAEVQRAVVAYLESRGCVVVRANSGAVAMPATATSARRFVRFNTAPGCSDLLVCFRGQFVAMEVKAATGKLTEKQRGFLDRIVKAGGVGVVVRSVSDAAAVLASIEAGGGE